MNEALRASLEPVILALLAERADHGYNLMARIKAGTGQDLSDGSLYPALARLEAAGKIEGRWMTPEGGRKRKVFHLTTKGREHLERARSQWGSFADRMTMILGLGGA